MAFVAAYLLVLQTALAGLAVPHVERPTGLAAEVMCVNAQVGAFGGEGERHAFDCCGVGCLVGIQTLQGPASPGERLVRPLARDYAAAAPAEAGVARSAQARGPRPRGPPALG